MKRVLLISLTLTVAFFGTRAAPFQNLDFESATLNPIPNDSFNRVYFDQAFPGWRGNVGGIQETAAFHNGMFLCCSSIAVWGDETNRNLSLEGTFSVALHASHDPYSSPQESRLANTSVAQTGFVPSDAQSLLFRAQVGGPVEAALGGQPLSLMPVAVGPNYTVFGADITAWAGQETELRLTAIAQSMGNLTILDSIEFSTTPVPEPSTFALLAIAGAFGWLKCLR
jgi:hypothetical protein